jgi:hypothetical protein
MQVRNEVTSWNLQHHQGALTIQYSEDSTLINHSLQYETAIHSDPHVSMIALHSNQALQQCDRSCLHQQRDDANRTYGLLDKDDNSFSIN